LFVDETSPGTQVAIIGTPDKPDSTDTGEKRRGTSMPPGYWRGMDSDPFQTPEGVEELRRMLEERDRKRQKKKRAG